MERQRQSLEEILGKLSRLDASWEDDHARAVIASLSSIPDGGPYQEEHIQAVLDQDFDAGRTAVRLVLDLSKDEFEAGLRERLGGGGTGITRYRLDAKELLAALRELGLFDKLEALANSPVTWRDILVERLKSGRGSATKGRRVGGSSKTSRKARSSKYSGRGTMTNGADSSALRAVVPRRRTLRFLRAGMRTSLSR